MDRAAYAALVADRRSCRACSGLTNPAAFEDGRYDSDQIGPWSLWQGNIGADVVIVGQDWGDTRNFMKYAGHERDGYRTNNTLRTLLHSVGIDIPAPTAADAGGGIIFLTNAVLCLKNGGMQANVKPEWFSNCGSRFLRPTINLITPKVLVSLGAWAYRAIVAAYALPRIAFRRAVDDAEGFRLMTGSRYFPMYHCGARILNTHRPMHQQLRDWERVRQWLNTERALRD